MAEWQNNPHSRGPRKSNTTNGQRSDYFRSDHTEQDTSGLRNGRSALANDSSQGPPRRTMADSDVGQAPANNGVQPEQQNMRAPSSARQSSAATAYRGDTRQGSAASQPQRPGSKRTSSLSFYDVKQLQKQGIYRPPGPTQTYSYDFKGGDAISQYNYDGGKPPHMGVPPKNQNGSAPVPGGLMWPSFMNSTAKNHIVASIGEFVGTTMFLFFAFAGAEIANIGNDTPAGTITNQVTGFSPIKLLYIALSFGFSLMVNVWVFFRISGGLFNPAVTLSLFLVGAVPAFRAVCLCLSQLVGSIAASAMVKGIFPTELNVITTLSGPTSLVRGVFIEAFCTAELVFTILMLAKEKHRATFIAPVGIGLALFLTQLIGVFYTGGSVNPARSFGPCVVNGNFNSEHWIYWVGPLVGALIAVAFYQFIKLLEYEMANPGQDADDWNDPTKNHEHELRERQRVKTAKILHSLGLDHFGHIHDPEKGVDAGRGSADQTIREDDLETPIAHEENYRDTTDNVRMGESAAGVRA